MKKSDVIEAIFHQAIPDYPSRENGFAFAPTNIALCKYWGKRNTELNLPITASLSVSLPGKGAGTQLSLVKEAKDTVILNGVETAGDTEFAKRLIEFLDLFRPKSNWRLKIEINMNIPVAAGLASSACGFASLMLAMDTLFGWNLKKQALSVLARLGSGSASRSFWPGFVEWNAGIRPDGMDSYGEPLNAEWPGLCLGIISVSDQPKPVSSRAAMQRTVDTSGLYASWPKKVAHDLPMIKQAIQSKHFPLLGGASESNALSMHATLLSSWPPICYSLPETLALMQQVWSLRKDGLELYFTQDAGPNLKLLFLDSDKEKVQQHFPGVDVIRLFE